FLPKESFQNVNDLKFSLKMNGEIKQQGNTANMLFSINAIIAYASQFFTLKIGDLIFTGTPEGVGPISVNDSFEAFLEDEKVLDLKIK
ncbi:MAG: 2-keto-4-pentenoate hydratase/2-oxohepta-3-ene-1,7-dioic acid hydratase in catechol pathway, partial [Vicingaceae bacterium]